MKRSHLAVAVVVCTALAAVAWWALQTAPRPVELARVTRGRGQKHEVGKAVGSLGRERAGNNLAHCGNFTLPS